MTRDNQYQLLFPSCLVRSNHSPAPLRSHWKWPVSGEPYQTSAEWWCLTCAATGKELVLKKQYRSPCTMPQPGPQAAASSPLLLCRAAKSKAAKPGPCTALDCNTYSSTTSANSAGNSAGQTGICKYRQGKVISSWLLIWLWSRCTGHHQLS